MPASPAGDISKYLKSRPSDFVHPGIWHTHDDLERIRNGVLEGKDPWASTYEAFSKDSYSQATYEMKGPKTNALMWYITRDDAHWNRSTTILDSWGSTLVDIIGTDRSLLIGLEGDLFVNAAEIMRWEGKWTEAGARWQGGSGFSIQLYWLFSRQSIPIGQANYGMASIKALLSFAVYLDDVTLYNYAINEYLNNPCAGLYSMFEPKTGQNSESGRDQSIGWAAQAARVAQSQGSDLYSQGDNLLLKGGEYTAEFNLNQTVTYDPKWFRCEAVLVNGPWATISQDKRGVTASNPMWDILYYQYVVKKKLDAPWTTKAKQTVGPEGRLTGSDHPSWGGLIWAY
ncbi:glycoside hydrolase family 92 protein [Colletotrichum tofieldiae]|nr:glycoside hydrolase family 92 protein [Colletotrichum tofieldiae]